MTDVKVSQIPMSIFKTNGTKISTLTSTVVPTIGHSITPTKGTHANIKFEIVDIEWECGDEAYINIYVKEIE